MSRRGLSAARLVGRKWGRRGADAWAIVVQSAITVALILLVGTQAGRDAFDVALNSIGLKEGLPCREIDGGFGTLFARTAPVYWGLCLLGGVAVFVLRVKDRGAMRPYTIPFYPLPPLVLCAGCAYVLYKSCNYAGWLALVGLVPLAVGGLAWMFVRANVPK